MMALKVHRQLIWTEVSQRVASIGFLSGSDGDAIFPQYTDNL